MWQCMHRYSLTLISFSTRHEKKISRRKDIDICISSLLNNTQVFRTLKKSKNPFHCVTQETFKVNLRIPWGTNYRTLDLDHYILSFLKHQAMEYMTMKAQWHCVNRIDKCGLRVWRLDDILFNAKNILYTFMVLTKHWHSKQVNRVIYQT